MHCNGDFVLIYSNLRFYERRTKSQHYHDVLYDVISIFIFMFRKAFPSVKLILKRPLIEKLKMKLTRVT